MTGPAAAEIYTLALHGALPIGVPAGSVGRSVCGQGGAGLTGAADDRQFERLPGTSARKPDPHQCGHDEDAEHQHDGAEYQPGRDAAGTLSGRRN